MVIERGSIHWADLGETGGSRPAKRRPVIVVQANPYNANRLATVVLTRDVDAGLRRVLGL